MPDFESEYVSPSKDYKSLIYYCSTCDVEIMLKRQSNKRGDPASGTSAHFHIPSPIIHNHPCDFCKSKKRTYLLAHVFDGFIGETGWQELYRVSRFLGTIKPVLRVPAPPVEDDNPAALDDAW